MDAVAFTLHGVPEPQGSKTAATAKSGRAFVREDNKALEPWRNAVAGAAVAAMAGRPPLAGELELDVVFVFPRPKAHYGTGRNAGKLKASAPAYCSTRPDVDKLVRAIGDALTGIAFVDDAQVVELRAAKHYGAPAAHVSVRRLAP